MGAPRHRILRLRIELRTDDSDEGARLQRSLGGLARRRVIPLVEQLLDARAADEETCRIEHVKIELGEVDSARLEEQLVAGLRDQLGPALSQAIAGARATERAEAAPLELLTCFARTGALPWWAPIERADLVDDALTTLAREQPTRLVAAILSLSRETPTIPRLAAHCSESTLALVIDLLRAPSRLRGLHQGEGAAAVIEELAALIAESGAFLPGTRGRRLLWRCLLEEVCVGGSGRPRERYAAILRRAAALGRLRAATLLDALARYERPRHGRRGHADAASSRAAARPGDEDEASQRARGEAVSVPVQTPRDEQVGTPGDVHELRAP
ncbi:MAG: hypothetical protein KC636_09185, partial [Myxococcales bacterium]|nr:hypothetical protein [Myxococcales bacterium]